MKLTYSYGLFDEPPKSETLDKEAAEVAPVTEPAAAAVETSAEEPAPTEPAPTESWTSEIRGLKNLTDETISRFPAKPWEWESEPPAVVLSDKMVFAAWSKKPTTDHLFYTGIEGINPMLRVNKENAPEIIHAIVIDYDGMVLDDQLATLGSKLPKDLLPTFTSRSRFSGGARLVWILENPLQVGGQALAEAFLKHAAKELKLKLLAPGFDEESLRPKQTFEVGTDWKRLGGPLRPETVQSWLFKAAMRADAKLLNEDKDAISIPLDDIAREVERQFPGRWSGNFEKGARGVVFFDPTSVNPTAAMVVDEGMICYGQPKTFYPWKEVLGNEFVRKYDEDRISAATSDIWYAHVSKKLFLKNKRNNQWEEYAEHHLDLHFMEGCKLSRETARSAKYYVIHNKRVAVAQAVVGDPREIVMINGSRVLNTWIRNVMNPAAGTAGAYGDSFPWLAEFFDTRFDKAHDPTGFAKWHLLAWWKFFYKNMYDGSPSNGQAIAISGGTSVGKTLFLDKILGASVGGSADATNLLQGNTSFNSQLMECPVWSIDDGSFTADYNARKKFADLIKKSAATALHEFHKKNQAGLPTLWYGRSVILLNTDPESILAIPKLDVSNRDKFNLYRWVEKSVPFPSRTIVEETIARELPYMLRWLIEFEPSAHGIVSNTRFGVDSYIENTTAEEAEDASGSGAFEQVLAEVCRKSGMTGAVNMSTVSLVMSMGAIEELRLVVNKYTPQNIGSLLRSLASRSDPTISKLPSGWWTLHVDKLLDRYGSGLSAPTTITVDLSA